MRFIGVVSRVMLGVGLVLLGTVSADCTTLRNGYGYTEDVTDFFGASIGNPAVTGRLTAVLGGYDLSGGGSRLGGTADQFAFGYRSYTNDFDLRVRVASATFASAWTRVGLMARDGLATNAPFAASLAALGSAGCHSSARTTAGGPATMSGSFPVNFPDTWLRLRRVGNGFDGFASLDGRSWEYLGSATITVSNVVQVGFAVAAGDAGGSTAAGFREFTDGGGTITTNGVLPFEPLGPCSRRTPLVISEIMYHPPAAWAGGEDLEFVELWNSGLVTEDLTGHRLEGEIKYHFPDGTTIAPGQFLVIARNPGLAQSHYGVDCLGPYEQRLNNAGGVLHLVNELGGRLLTIEYAPGGRWPVAPNGAGHSLVLSRPSFGENDPRAWSASDLIGGSPGTFESCGNEPARGVVINEFFAHTDDPQQDYVELFNPGDQPVSLAGAWLSDTAEVLKYRIPDDTMIGARGLVVFTQTQLGFALSSAGEKLFLVNSNQSRVLDAVVFDGQENGVTTGRYPDGAPGFQRLATVTEGTANTPPRISPVRINEIMYHPISGREDEEYVELHNRSAGPISLAGWQLQDGIRFTFPSNVVLAAGGYVVAAKNAVRLLAQYPQLNATNTFGDFSGALRNRGERIVLARPDEIGDGDGSTVIYIPMDEVTYQDGGRWGQWADGGGSSLELRDPRADGRLAANWADSDESAKAPWTTIELTSILENGQTAAMINQGSYQGRPNRFEFFLQGAGEVIVDNLEFRNNGGANLIANGTFDTGTTGWTLGGVMRRSYAQPGVGIGGSQALHAVATARGDTGPNKARTALTGPVATNSPNTGTIRASVRWLRGSPDILFRLHGHWMEVSHRLNVPGTCGTPGLPNSRLVANAGPAITDVTHTPVLPAANQPVVVLARASDPDGLGALVLRYRVDPGTAYSSVAMLDDGTGGDAAAGDGVYSVTLPARPAGTLVAFYLSGTDTAGGTSLFPAEAPTRECLVRWGESVRAGTIGNYRLWVTASNITFWTNREKNANDPLDATFVYGNQRVVYNVDTLYSGSPFHAPAYNGPVGSFACDYEVNFPPDDRLLGSEPFVLTAYDVTSGSFFHNDLTGQVDLTGNWIARKLGLPHNYRRHVHLFVNGLARGTIYDDVQQPNAEFIEAYFPDDDEGQLRKIEDWFEFADDNLTLGITTATITRYNRSTGAIDPKRYRWTWRPRATRDPDDWTPFTSLVLTVNDSVSPEYLARVRTWMDLPNFLRPIVTHHIVGDWDSYGYERGKNMYAYKPGNAPWRLLMWDIELALGYQSRSATDSIYNIQDATLRNLINNQPAIHREYLRGFYEAVNTSLLPGAADLLLDERYASFQQNAVPLHPPQGIKNYLAARRAYLLGVLPNALFAVNNPSYQVVSGSNVLALTGSTPLSGENLLVNGRAYAVTWTGVTAWRILVPLAAGTNELAITATDRAGNLLTNATGQVTANYTGSTPAPEEHVVVNEIMYQPAAPGAAFLELYNTHLDHTFDLSGWNVNGLGYTFPPGATLPPRRYLVLGENPFVYGQTYGLTNVLFAQFPGNLDADGETLTLFRPTSGTNVAVVDRVRYEIVPPWTAPSNGVSLQLVDAAQDNSRVANWKSSSSANPLLSATPGRGNSVAASLPAFPPLWLNEAQPNNVTGPLDNFGEREPWLELFNPAGTNVSLSGYFLTDTYTNLTKWAFPTGAAAASGFTLVWCDQQTNQTATGSLHAGFALATGSGGVALTRLVNGATQVVDYLNYQNLPANWSHGSVPDGQPFYRREMFYVTPSATNDGALSPLTVFINEWLADNVATLADPADGQFEDWFELYNPGTNAADLGGYYLTDNLTNKFQFQIPDNGHYVIPPGGYLLVWADNEANQNSTNSTDLHASFALARNGEAIGLFAADGTTIDAVTFGPQQSGVSEGRFPDGAAGRHAMPTPTPRAPNVVPNTPPTLAPITNRVVTLGQTLTLSAVANDTNIPAQTLTYHLAGAPAGASIGLATGVVTWTPGTAPTTNQFVIVVSDNGTPSLSATQSFTVIVVLPPTLAGFARNGDGFTFSWLSMPGQFYQVEYKDDLNELEWRLIGALMAGTGGTLTFTNLVAGSPQRFFRVRVLTQAQAFGLRPILLAAPLNQSQFTLSWNTLPGQRFQLESTTALTDDNWLPAGDPHTGTGQILRVTNSFSPSPREFYRLRLLP